MRYNVRKLSSKEGHQSNMGFAIKKTTDRGQALMIEPRVELDAQEPVEPQMVAQADITILPQSAICDFVETEEGSEETELINSEG